MWLPWSMFFNQLDGNKCVCSNIKLVFAILGSFWIFALGCSCLRMT